MRSYVVLFSFAIAACDAPAAPQFGPGSGLHGFGADDAGSGGSQVLYGTLVDAGPTTPTTVPAPDAGSTSPPSDPSTTPPAASSDPPPSDPPPPPSGDLIVCAIGSVSHASLSYTKAMGTSASVGGSWTAYDLAGNAIANGTCPAPSISDGATAGSTSCNALVFGAARIVYSFHGTNLLSMTPDFPSTC